MRNEKGDITMDVSEMKSIIRDNCELLYANQLDNPLKMGKFLETYNPLKLN